MAGNMIFTYLKEKGHNCVGLSKVSTQDDIIACDACDFKQLDEIINNQKPDIIINAIGILNKSADEHMEQALILNSLLPIHLQEITENSKIRVFQMSTDCVFSGTRGNYTEKDFPDGTSWYDRTKAMGELNNLKDLTFRNSIIGPDVNVDGIGLFNWFMKQKGEINGYSKAIWTGVTTLELAKAMEKASEQNVSGLFNCVNNTTISKFDILQLFKKYMNKDDVKTNKLDTFKIDKSLKSH